MRVTGLASSAEGAKHSTEEFDEMRVSNRGLFDDYSTVGVMKQWRVCLVSQSIFTEKRQRLLTATGYKRELMHMLSADTMIAEDGLAACTQFYIHGAYTQSFFHMGAFTGRGCNRRCLVGQA